MPDQVLAELDRQVARRREIVLGLLARGQIFTFTPRQISGGIRVLFTGRPDTVLTEMYEHAIRLVTGEAVYPITDPVLARKSRARDVEDLDALAKRIASCLDRAVTSAERKKPMFSFGYDADAIGAVSAATTLKNNSIKLQQAIVNLGKLIPDSALLIKVDGGIGTNTATALNRIFTKHIGSGQADAKWRTGKLTAAQIKPSVTAITLILNKDIANRQSGAYTRAPGAIATTTTTAPAKPLTAKEAAIALQTAIVALGRAIPDAALNIGIDGGIGTQTTTAINKIFTKHVGLGLADAKWRTGKLTTAQIKLAVPELTKLVNEEIVRRQTGAYQKVAPAATASSASKLAATQGRAQAVQFLQGRMDSMLKTVSDIAARMNALPASPAAVKLKAEWTTFLGTVNAWKVKSWSIPEGAAMAAAVTSRDKEISGFTARLNTFVQALATVYRVDPKTLPADLKPKTPITLTAKEAPIALQTAIVELGRAVSDASLNIGIDGGIGTETMTAVNKVFPRYIGQSDARWRTGKLTVAQIKASAPELARLVQEEVARRQSGAAQPAGPTGQGTSATQVATNQGRDAAVKFLQGRMDSMLKSVSDINTRMNALPATAAAIKLKSEWAAFVGNVNAWKMKSWSIPTGAAMAAAVTARDQEISAFTTKNNTFVQALATVYRVDPKALPADLKPRTPVVLSAVEAALALQTAIVDLGRAVPDAALTIQIGGGIGPETAGAVNRIFTKHIGPGQADAKWRTGKLTSAQVKANVAELTRMIREDVTRRQTSTAQPAGPTGQGTSATQVATGQGRDAAIKFLQGRMESMLKTVNDVAARMAALPNTDAANQLKGEWAAFVGAVNAWKVRAWTIPTGAGMAAAVTARDVEISRFTTRLNTFIKALATVYRVDPDTLPDDLKPIAIDANATALQTTIVELGQIIPDQALIISIGDGIGPQTTGAVNRIFTKHIGPDQASTRWRTGKLTAAQVKADVPEIQRIFTIELDRRKSLQGNSVDDVVNRGREEAMAYLQARQDAMLAAVSATNDTINALPKTTAASALRSQWAAFVAAVDAWKVREWTIPTEPVAMKNAVAIRDREISTFSAKNNTFVKSASAIKPIGGGKKIIKDPKKIDEPIPHPPIPDEEPWYKGKELYLAGGAALLLGLGIFAATRKGGKATASAGSATGSSSGTKTRTIHRTNVIAIRPARRAPSRPHARSRTRVVSFRAKR